MNSGREYTHLIVPQGNCGHWTIVLPCKHPPLSNKSNLYFRLINTFFSLANNARWSLKAPEKCLILFCSQGLFLIDL